MTTTPYNDADHMTNHWWWRPGWSVGTRYYTWHITIDSHPDIQARVARYQNVLADVPSLDPIPEQWLHLTVQGVSHTKDITDNQRDAIIHAVEAHLHEIPPPQAVFQYPVIHGEAVVLPPNDPEPLRDMRRAIRAGITDILGHVGEQDTFVPHVSIAYSNAEHDSAPVRQLLDTVHPEPIMVSFNTVSLIVLNRDNRCYQWETIHRTQMKSSRVM